MSVDFRPNTTNSNPDTYINLANGNAARVLDILGLRVDLSGECAADTFVYLCNRTFSDIFAGKHSDRDRDDLVYLVGRLTDLRIMAYDAYMADNKAKIIWS